ncbi:MAG: UDP-N-acetylmuramoyl-tripeptide-D-alanyl-D-alanine ligase [Candidatus Nomurabacteria bacterium GW2011_GWA2_40_9]|uniref:UDP-N-acetylmuramoyl-tripeptide-D-alanyl-D-alanine ligase n=1 Tax=Candidatus Nomurabacteria bacterium GW2011_GWA2_40_9 TaxID=1618734 RepID=A0A0G0WWR7_9BACT|nr:MAG: UDP-N-acetylmuramoyl-tripeptide-D-alanyl-D-alanine ligase [Candidatus Nomurabacteria bacterium GW2011_GWA2_40_9]
MKIFFKKIIIYILQLESRLVLNKYKPKVVAITGSVGKTSTKDAVYAVLSEFAYVRKSEKSYNSQIGLPLTILGVPNAWNSPTMWLKNILKGLWLVIWPHKYPEWLILEVGVGKPGDMQETASWLSTDAVIMTAIGETPAHIEFFSSRKHLIEEKSGLIKTLKKPARNASDIADAGGAGLLILNADDEVVLSMKSKTKNITVTYGFQKDSDFLASEESILYVKEDENKTRSKSIPQGIMFRIDEDGSSLPVVIEGVFGRNHVYAALAALALAHNLKLNMIQAINSLKNYKVPPGRMRLLTGIKNTLIIDDTYNSSPFACESALKTIGVINKESKLKNRKIAILGDMLELGKYTEEAHKNIGKLARENIDVLAVVGARAKAIKAGALEAGFDDENIFEFMTSVEAGEWVKTFIKKGDIVLFKGSQGMRMERAVEAILEDQENKHDLLVRQDKEWLDKK